MPPMMSLGASAMSEDATRELLPAASQRAKVSKTFSVQGLTEASAWRKLLEAFNVQGPKGSLTLCGSYHVEVTCSMDFPLITLKSVNASIKAPENALTDLNIALVVTEGADSTSCVASLEIIVQATPNATPTLITAIEGMAATALHVERPSSAECV